MVYKGYKDLKSYIQTRLLRIFISDLAKKFPPHEKYIQKKNCYWVRENANSYLN